MRKNLKTFYIELHPYARWDTLPVERELVTAKNLLEAFAASKLCQKLMVDVTDVTLNSEAAMKKYLNNIDIGGEDWLNVFEVRDGKFKFICGEN